ncbi:MULTISPECIES: phage major tail tube protein [Paenibacillus]|uniref:phage major tail tube protein n=1 Tax=Paenibacillus TaxID=44249 RepID=UPI0022B8D87F|nr:phage major tail tube protein [Paenibacillus caseinilyticus]MCZ8520126.1 phage major tail tube protein [Paenibacillus caseinilyticus]
MNNVPEKLISYSVYHNGNDFLGTADVQLPSLEAMTDTVSGAGIAGEVDSPTIGHYSSMTLGLNWRTITKNNLSLAAPVAHALDFRGSMQVYDPASGQHKPVPVKVSVRAMPKKTDLGKGAVGATMDTANEFEVVYIKVLLDGKTMVEIDKYNYICIIDGIDYLKKIKEQLGM